MAKWHRKMASHLLKVLAFIAPEGVAIECLCNITSKASLERAGSSLVE